MIILEKPSSHPQFVPNMQTCMYLIFSIGVIATVILILGLLYLAALLLNLVVAACGEAIHQIGALYLQSDSLTRLIMLVVIGCVLYRVARSLLARKVR